MWLRFMPGLLGNEILPNQSAYNDEASWTISLTPLKATQSLPKFDRKGNLRFKPSSSTRQRGSGDKERRQERYLT